MYTAHAHIRCVPVRSRVTVAKLLVHQLMFTVVSCIFGEIIAV